MSPAPTDKYASTSPPFRDQATDPARLTGVPHGKEKVAAVSTNIVMQTGAYGCLFHLPIQEPHHPKTVETRQDPSPHIGPRGKLRCVRELDRLAIPTRQLPPPGPTKTPARSRGRVVADQACGVALSRSSTSRRRMVKRCLDASIPILT